MNRNDENDESLKLCGLKKTKHREAILSILRESTQPISAEDIFLSLKRSNISINLSTVYRILEVLSEKNLITKLSIGGDNKNLYEYNQMVHRHYLVCMECKRIKVIDDCPLKGYEKALADKTDYMISGHKLDIYGICPECRKKGLTKDK